jgi:hypothetical protein
MWPASQAPRHIPAGSGRDWGLERGESWVTVIPPCSSTVRPYVTFITVADQQVTTMSLSRGRLVRVPAAGPLVVGGSCTQLAGLHVSVDVDAQSQSNESRR